MSYFRLIWLTFSRVFFRQRGIISTLNLLIGILLLISFGAASTAVGSIIGSAALLWFVITSTILLSVMLSVFARGPINSPTQPNSRLFIWLRALGAITGVTVVGLVALLPSYLYNSGLNWQEMLVISLITSLLSLATSVIGVAIGYAISATAKSSWIRLAAVILVGLGIYSQLLSKPIQLIDGVLLRSDLDDTALLLIAVMALAAAAITLLDLLLHQIGPIVWPKRFSPIFTSFHTFGNSTNISVAVFTSSILFWIRNSAIRNRAKILLLAVLLVNLSFTSQLTEQAQLILIGGIVGCLVAVISFISVSDRMLFPTWLPIRSKSERRANWTAGLTFYLAILLPALLLTNFNAWHTLFVIIVAFVSHSAVVAGAERLKHRHALSGERLVSLAIAGTLFGLLPGTLIQTLTNEELLLLLGVWAAGLGALWLLFHRREDSPSNSSKIYLAP